MKAVIGLLGILAFAGFIFSKAADTVTIASGSIAKHELTQRAAIE